jgi:dTDP-4-amino-4,6-dideoxygalactose transaminase
MSRAFAVPLIKPYVTPEVKAKVCEVLDSGFLTEGPVTRALEQAFREYVGCRHAFAVTSCTTGLELALRALKIGPGDEVIVPDFTYPATADVVAIVGATAVLVDVSPETFLIDYAAAERAVTPRTRAILAVSEFGNPLDHDRLAALKKKHGLRLIEDAACSLGSDYRGVRTGNWADISVFSLHPRKFITTGEGGIVTTNNPTWAEWIDAYKHFGITGKDATGKPSFEHVGTNYKLSDILSAVGVVQMGQIHELLADRRAVAQHYLHLLRGEPRVTLPTTTADGGHSWQSFCVRVGQRDAVLERVRARGIEVQFGAFALHAQPAFRPGPHCRWDGTLYGSRQAFDEALALPLYHGMSAPTQEHVVAALREALDETRTPQRAAG